jgi:hypothetical protein
MHRLSKQIERVFGSMGDRDADRRNASTAGLPLDRYIHILSLEPYKRQIEKEFKNRSCPTSLSFPPWWWWANAAIEARKPWTP